MLIELEGEQKIIFIEIEHAVILWTKNGQCFIKTLLEYIIFIENTTMKQTHEPNISEYLSLLGPSH